jgi:predicted nucleic acid-binding protein
MTFAPFAGTWRVVLVDSTVWIDWLRRRPSAACRLLDRLLDDGEAVIAPVILQEVLQGAASPQALRTLRRRFGALPLLEPEPGGGTHAEAGALYARCRWAGITPRSPHVCLIAQLAIEHRVALLHDDRDFERIAEVEQRLQQSRG